MNQTWPNKSQKWVYNLATVVFLVPIFFQRVFIGGEGDSYDDYWGFSLSFLGYLIHFVFLAIGVLKYKQIVLNNRVRLFAVFIAALSVLQLLLTASQTGFPIMELCLPLGRGFVWLFSTLVYVLLFFDRNVFRSIFLKMCRFSTWSLVIFSFSYFATGMAFGVHIARGYPRVHGFFSEPSALAGILTAFLLISIAYKNKFDMILSIVGIMVSASVIVYSVAAFGALLYFMRVKFKNRTFIFWIYLYAFGMAGLPLVLNQANAELISKATNLLNEYVLRYVPADGFLYRAFLGRIFDGLNLLGTIISTYSIDNLGGSLARLIGPIVTIDELRKFGLQYLGFGLNVYGYMCIHRFGDIFDFGLFPYMLSSFGIPLGLMGLWIIVSRVVGELKNGNLFGLIGLGVLLATTVNSAGGIHAYTILLIPVFLRFAQARPSLNDLDRPTPMEVQ